MYNNTCGFKYLWKTQSYARKIFVEKLKVMRQKYGWKTEKYALKKMWKTLNGSNNICGKAKVRRIVQEL